MNEQTKTSFKVILDGETYNDHEIQIFTFAKSLKAIGELLYETSAEINGSRDVIDVKVNADFIPGSFGFVIDVFQNLEIKNVVEAVGFVKAVGAASGVGGLLSLMKSLKGKDVESYTNTDGSATIETEDGNKVIYKKEVVSLIKNTNIRKSMDSLVREPLLEKGTNNFKIESLQQDDNSEILITKEDIHSFVKLKTSDYTDEKTIPEDKTIIFVAANINSSVGWKIDNKAPKKGEKKEIPIKMTDKEFILKLKEQNIEAAHIFGKPFKVRFLTIKKTVNKKTTTTFEISKVY
ncbi:hypothetical protein [Marinicellulosiphila megalodicopiae]|uniref:hypothetical protein n=1 Tax=Marinicellulosiphila megalodicopiae TaxID=2724896 RepID=UPI003BB1EF22